MLFDIKVNLEVKTRRKTNEKTILPWILDFSTQQSFYFRSLKIHEDFIHNQNSLV